MLNHVEACYEIEGFRVEAQCLNVPNSLCSSIITPRDLSRIDIYNRDICARKQIRWQIARRPTARFVNCDITRWQFNLENAMDSQEALARLIVDRLGWEIR